MILTIIQTIENETERDAITAIFNEHFPKMLAVAYDILKNKQDAEDAAMNAMKYMCEHPENFTDYMSKKAINLVFLCTKSAAIDIYRKNQRRSKLLISYESWIEETSPDDYETPDLFTNILINQETKQALAEAIEKLDDMYKFPIVLKYNYQMKNHEIADLLHIDVNTVNGRIFRAKKILQQKLKDAGCER